MRRRLEQLRGDPPSETYLQSTYTCSYGGDLARKINGRGCGCPRLRVKSEAFGGYHNSVKTAFPSALLSSRERREAGKGEIPNGKALDFFFLLSKTFITAARSL